MTPDESNWQQWCDERRQEIGAPDSWLGLLGLYWLEEGINRVGNAPDAAVVLPTGPACLGEVRLAGNRLSWRTIADEAVSIEHPSAGEASSSGVAEAFLQPEGTPFLGQVQGVDAAPINLQTDVAGLPSLISFGALRFFVISREGRFAVRLKNREWAKTTAYAGLDYFPFNPGWQMLADWQTLAAPYSLEVPSVTGELKVVEISHQAIFEHAGARVALLPLSIDESGVFFVFRDRSSGKESYGGGRFLRAALPQNGKIKLDFNRATNPPCAFSPFATCPLPPPENWLSFPVEAGEKKYSAH